MSELRYNLQFDKLCNVLKLGRIIGSPEPISGGLLHKMFSVETLHGKYAIKALNPQIMLRPAAMQNTINSENIATIAAKNVSAAPARIFDGKAIQEIDGQYYLVFDYIYGKSLFGNGIKASHCEQIGIILAKIHATDFSELGLIDSYTADEPVPDWNFYLQKGEEANAVWADILRGSIDNLYEFSDRLCRSAKILSHNTVITHGDLDPKNVIWSNDTPILIDWEAAGFINPMDDLLETAVYWSKGSSDMIDKTKFMALINGYKKVTPNLKADWKVVLNKGFSGLLGWLEYSLKRSLWIECTDEDENKMGTEHVTETMDTIIKYAESIKQLEEWLKEV